MALKDWWSVTLSTAAFGISALGAYASMISQSDELRAMPGQIDISYSQADQSFKIEPDGKLTLINSGNRSLVVTSVRHRVFEPGPKPNGPLKDQCNRHGVTFRESSWEFQPVVIKPGEIAVLDAKADTILFKATDAMKGQKPSIQVCYFVRLSTPSASVEMMKFVNGTEVGSLMRSAGSTITFLAKDEAGLLYRRWGTIFSSSIFSNQPYDNTVGEASKP